MPHCFDCNSSYETPGTCNCFAVGGKRAPTITVTGTPSVPPKDEPRCDVCTGPLWQCQGRHVRAVWVPAGGDTPVIARYVVHIPDGGNAEWRRFVEREIANSGRRGPT